MKKTRKRSDGGSPREFLNQSLEFVREKCPHLVVVAASMLPFKDAVIRHGILTDPETGERGLLYDLKAPCVPEGFEVIAFVSAEKVLVKQIDSDDDTVLSVHEFTLPMLWEYLRSLPRGISAFGSLTWSAFTKKDDEE